MPRRKISQREAREWKKKATGLQNLLRNFRSAGYPGDGVSVLHVGIGEVAKGRLSMAVEVGRMLVARSRGDSNSVQVYAVEVPRDLMRS